MTLVGEHGFAARSGPEPGRLLSTLATAGVTEARHAGGTADVATWGLPEWDVEREALLLSAGPRRHEHDLSATELRDLVLHEPADLTEVLPTFAAAVSEPGGATSVVADELGFRHVFHGHRGGTAIASTSSRVCAAELGTDLDLEAVAVQSALGWQLGQRTLFNGVSKLPPGGIATVARGGVSVTSYRRPLETSTMSLDHAVAAAAELLRTYLTAYLEEHPDAGLQLTGGQDSRLLLSAIPRHRRAGLRVVTLGQPGDPDLDIAAGLAQRFGMRHEILSLSGLEELHPAQAYQLCLAAAGRLDYSADPLAHAALSFAEAKSEPGPRLSGLGGEIARGFYYFGLPVESAVSERRARRLARWRMFANEAVPTAAIDSGFGSWARDFATREVVRVLAETGRPWLSATDELYLGHRMQRWGGITETAVCLHREIVNPMLDDRFLSIALALEPRDKRGSRFLSRLQLTLDDELASLPMDGRPPPAAYADRSLRHTAQLTSATAHRARRKVLQRLRGETRPPVGGEILAAKVVAHWRENPSELESLRPLGIFAEPWLDDLVTSDQPIAPSAVALMVNLLGAVAGTSPTCSDVRGGNGSGHRR